MRVACLQFAPQVGDIDNNLNRADAVLSRANPEDIDLLVLPELAFTGYNFKSLQQISQYLEPSGSGISSLWARTTALKHDCAVIVGYPEKVDVKPKWPTSPEYYNSAIIVNADGETIGNYRNRFLFPLDETWALEGPEGFFEGYIPGLGNTSMGICMDINPYKFEAPWHAFEFAFHVLEVESNLVVVSMAWLTREDGRMFSRMPKEPDMETLYYWVTRLEPIIRSENKEEIIVVFCNRTGIEDDAVYAGTSAVLGIKDGEVSLYGMLGRGDKELLVVDTDAPPFAKLVYRPDAENGSSVGSTDGDGSYLPPRVDSPSSGRARSLKDVPKSSVASNGSIKDNDSASSVGQSPRSSKRVSLQAFVNSDSSKRNGILASHLLQIASPTASVLEEYEHIPLAMKSKAGSDSSTRSHQGSMCSARSRASKSSRRSVRSKASKSSADSKARQETEPAKSITRKQKPPSPKIEIPPTPKDKDTVPTPTGPSPTPQTLRPKLVIPTDAHKMPPVPHIPTPHPSAGGRDTNQIYSGRVSIRHRNDIVTPTTAFDDDSPASPRFYWLPTDSMLRSPVEPRDWPAGPHESSTTAVNGASAVQNDPEEPASASTQRIKSPRPSERPASRSSGLRSNSRARDETDNSGQGGSTATQTDSKPTVRPATPKSRNASRSRQHDRSDSPFVRRPDWAAIAQRLEALSPRPKSSTTQRSDTHSPRPGSAVPQQKKVSSDSQGVVPQRPSSPKSRNASRTRPMDTDEWLNDVERHVNVSRGSIPITASPSILDRQLPRGASALSYRPDTRMTNIDAAFRPTSRAAHTRSNSMGGADSKFSYRTGTPAGYDSATAGSELRAISRGRPRTPKESPIDGSDNVRDSPVPVRRPSAPAYGFRSPAEQAAELGRRSSNCPIHGVHLHSRGSGDDEIVREIIVRSSPDCPTHGRQSRETSLRRPFPRDPQDTEIAESRSLETSLAPMSDDLAAGADDYSHSVETLVSTKVSPATPQFNPSTPKAMVLIPGDDDFIPREPLSAPFLADKPKTLQVVERELVGNSIERPRSSVW